MTTTNTKPVLMTSRATGVHQRAPGTLSPEIMARIRDRSPDPSIWDSVSPFVWTAQISNDGIDSYHTRMDDQTLSNFARDADDGRAFLDSHIKHELPLGATILGERTSTGVVATAYTIPGVKLGRADTDSFIAGIRSGIVKDVSVGFAPERFECSICGEDPLSWTSACLHVPGGKYDRKGKPDAKGEPCFAWVRNARLLEVSAVFDGATPGAQIGAVLRSKAGEQLANGQLAPNEGLVLTRAANRLVQGHSTPAGGGASPDAALPQDWQMYAVSGGQGGHR